MNKDEKKSIQKELKKDKLKKANYKWVFKITIVAFFLSIFFSLISESLIPKVNIVIGILILIIFILIGIIFDMIGVAVQSADEAPFHSMNSRKIKGAKEASMFIKNADKFSSFCNDVIGDICGIISGTAGSIIALSIARKFNLDSFIITLIVTGIISAITIGGKAYFKSIAINKSNYILYNFARMIVKFKEM